MDTYSCNSQNSSSSQRGVAMIFALVSALVLSPLYATPRRSSNYQIATNFYDLKYWSSGFVLPMLLVSLIFAIKTTSSSSKRSSGDYDDIDRASFMASSSSNDPCLVFGIGSSTWGLFGVLVMLLLVLSWQDSVQHFFCDRFGSADSGFIDR